MEFRCEKCGRLFFKGDLIEGDLDVKCTKCGNFTTFEVEKEVSPGFIEVYTDKGVSVYRLMYEKNNEKK